MLSFHATKVFNTFEGGALVCPDAKTKQRVDYLKNFGHSGEVTVVAPGINGKMNEVQAAFGLLQLDHVDRLIQARQRIDAHYREALRDVPGITPYQLCPEATQNYSYFPVLVDESFPISRDALYQKMRARGIMVRRYFYPLISDFPMYRDLPSAIGSNLPIAADIANKVLCLPIYPNLETTTVDSIIDLITATA